GLLDRRLLADLISRQPAAGDRGRAAYIAECLLTFPPQRQRDGIRLDLVHLLEAILRHVGLLWRDGAVPRACCSTMRARHAATGIPARHHRNLADGGGVMGEPAHIIMGARPLLVCAAWARGPGTGRGSADVPVAAAGSSCPLRPVTPSIREHVARPALAHASVAAQVKST